jgi:hypothetical protein
MKAFAVKRSDGDFIDTIVRAADANDAKSLLADEGAVELFEYRSDLATSMGVPQERGRHNGALGRWIKGPTTLTGDLIKK